MSSHENESPRKMPRKMSKEWEKDFRTQIQSGNLIDIQTNVPFAELSDDYVNINVSLDECILIIPNDNVDEESKEIDGVSKNCHRVFRLPLLTPSVGHRCIDIRPLLSKSGVATYDPGFVSTASCHSAITFIDGPKGILLHRGYRIEEICANSDIEELSFLLLYGELPTKEDLKYHVDQINSHTMVHEKMIEFYKGFRYNAHPMAIMCAVVGALSSFYHDSMDITIAEHRVLCAYRLIAKMPTLAAMAYKTSIGQPIQYPQNNLSFAENFLYMMFAIPAEQYKMSKIKAKALDKFLMLHADHEQNASTS
eukprot:4711_1